MAELICGYLEKRDIPYNVVSSKHWVADGWVDADIIHTYTAPVMVVYEQEVLIYTKGADVHKYDLQDPNFNPEKFIETSLKEQK